MGKRGVVSVVCLLWASLAVGQIPSGNVYIGYAHTSTNLAPGQGTGLNGWNGSLEAKIFPFLGIVGDLSGFYGSQGLPVVCPVSILPTCPPQSSSANISEYNYLFGPRVSFRFRKFRPFVHALIGVSHVRASATGVSNSDTSFGDALGGGLDYRLISLVSWRLQFDALQTRFFSSSQSNLRFSTGIAVHF
jgi:opacity protein-like surface antigen